MTHQTYIRLSSMLKFGLLCFSLSLKINIVYPKTVLDENQSLFPSERAGIKLTDQIRASFNKTYTGNVTADSNMMYVYEFNVTDDMQTAVRLFSTSSQGQRDSPAIFVVRQERSVMSWQIPLVLHNRHGDQEYQDVSRTLCPDNTKQYQKIYVEVSTQASRQVFFTLEAIVLQDFVLHDNIDYAVSSSPSNPVYYRYQFKDEVKSVLVKAVSTDNTCAVLSIQETKCPVFDLDTDVEYQGKYQTMMTQGAITVNKENYDNGTFYVVVVVKPNDIECSNGFNNVYPAGQMRIREKNVTIHIKQTIPSSQYYKAVLAALGFFLAFYVVALFIGIFYHGCKENWGIVDLKALERSMSNTETSRPILVEGTTQNYGSLPNMASDTEDRSCSVDDLSGDLQDNGSVASDDYDFVRDADQDKDVFRTKTALYVCDLARKDEKRVDRNYKLYCKNLFTIAVFYGLPVIQLVMTYQTVLNFTGNQDICYYNFACAHPLGRVSSFNNIFSNIGYVLLGILFLILVYRREWLHKKAVERSEGRHKKVGIPQHFGLFYAMGFALVMEGIMSGCYHVCPTVSNFQFDTSFMYIIACLCILKIYQNRHPDISAKAHSSYFVMAIVIIIAVIGVIYGTNVFWVIFAIVYMTASMVLSIHLYYMGRWKLDRYIFKRLWLLIISDWMKCSRPNYCNRLILLLIGNIVNWSIAIYGALKESSSDFASFLLAIFIGNLLLYTLFYIFSKLFAKEKIPTLTISFIVLAAVTWGFALKFFVAHLTSWQLSPAGSREGNKECSLLGFYDDHDIWHFLSAVSLFFSFLVLLTLDDEIILIGRDKIPVF